MTESASDKGEYAVTDEEKRKIREGIEKVKENCKIAAEKSGRRAEDIRIVLATKTQSAEKINYALSCGINEIGENRVQEMLEKYDALNKENLHIHFIGTLQTNKVKYIIDKVELIHSVNSKKLAAEIDRQAEKHGKIMDVLIEINAADEESKTGVAAEEFYELLRYAATLPHIRVRGIMAIPPAPKKREDRQECFTNVNKLQIHADSRRYFTKIYQIFLDISTKKIDNIRMEILSLGMSADYVEAIEEGSNMIRPGRAVFGERAPLAPNPSDTL